MKNTLTTAPLIAAVLVLMLVVSAETEMAKEGDLSGTHSFSGTAKAMKIGEDLLLVTGENLGVLVSDSGTGPFHDLSGRCVGQVLYVKGVGRNQGYCVFMDRAGDQWLLEYTTPEQKLGATSSNGTAKYLGGTGKFAVVRGEGEYTGTPMRPIADGTYQGYSKFKGHYRLE